MHRHTQLCWRSLSPLFLLPLPCNTTIQCSEQRSCCHRGFSSWIRLSRAQQTLVGMSWLFSAAWHCKPFFPAEMHKWCGFQGTGWDRAAKLFPYCLTDDTSTRREWQHRISLAVKQQENGMYRTAPIRVSEAVRTQQNNIYCTFAPKWGRQQSEVATGSPNSALCCF